MSVCGSSPASSLSWWGIGGSTRHHARCIDGASGGAPVTDPDLRDTDTERKRHQTRRPSSLLAGSTALKTHCTRTTLGYLNIDQRGDSPATRFSTETWPVRRRSPDVSSRPLAFSSNIVNEDGRPLPNRAIITANLPNRELKTANLADREIDLWGRDMPEQNAPDWAI